MRSTPWPKLHLADRERRPRAAAAQVDDDALEDLDALLVAFLDPHVHLDRVARLHRRPRQRLRLLDNPHCVHRTYPLPSSPVAPVRSGRRARVRACAACPPPLFDLPVMPRHQHVGHGSIPPHRRPRVVRDSPAGRPRTNLRPPTARPRPRLAPGGPPRPASPAPAVRRRSARSRQSTTLRRRPRRRDARRCLRTVRTASTTRPASRHPPRRRLVEAPAGRTRDHHQPVAAPPRSHRLHREIQRLGLQHHARSAAERHVVDHPVAVGRVVPQVVHAHVDDAVRAAPGRPRLRRAPASIIRGKIVTTSNVTPSSPARSAPPGPVHVEQALRRRHLDAPAVAIHRAERLHERHEHFAARRPHDQARRARRRPPPPLLHRRARPPRSRPPHPTSSWT